MASEGIRFEADDFDFMLIEALVQHPGASYKLVARELHVDQRTVARRIKNLVRNGVLNPSFEIDWTKLGLQAEAWVGSTTARGIEYARKMNELVETDPRIVEAYETLGAYHYLMRVIDTDTYQMRASVLRDVDVLAAELTTTLVTKRLKKNYRSLIRYLRETRFPRTRDRKNNVS